jgi:L-seryl-tRNA(Ser) seleniumtransferase
MIAAQPQALEQRARGWVQCLSEKGLDASMEPGKSMVGGGSLPGESLPTYLLILQVANAARFTRRLRQARTPIVARVEDQRVAFDPRTVLPEQDDELLAGIMEALK